MDTTKNQQLDEILNQSHRNTPAATANGANGTNGSEKSERRRSAKNAKQGLATVQGKLSQAREKVREGTKTYIAGGFADALNDIAKGDFGQVGNEIVDAFDNFLDGIAIDVDTQALTLEASEIDPKRSLPEYSSFRYFSDDDSSDKAV